MFLWNSLSVQLALVAFTGTTCTTPLTDCPEESQRRLRRAAYCDNSSLYYICLNNTDNDNVIEICSNMTDYAGAGQKYVWTCNFRNVDCPPDRYQPYNLYRSNSHECQFLKSTCNELGQILHSNGTTDSDVSCRCDEAKGYKFVVQPTKKDYCIPSTEDCSCYLEPCSGNCSERIVNTMNISDIIKSRSIEKPLFKSRGSKYTAIRVFVFFGVLMLGFVCTVCLTFFKPSWVYGIDITVIREGDRVYVFDLSKIQQQEGIEWNDNMIEIIKQIGTVIRIKSDVIEVDYDGIHCPINREALKKVYDFKVGDNVKVLEDFETVKRLQNGHGGWVKYMKEACGKVGKVKKIDYDGDVAVKFGLQQWVYSPACLIPAPYQKVNLLTGKKSKQSSIDITVIREGDRVYVFDLSKIQQQEGIEWNDNMIEIIKQIGTVIRIKSDVIEVDYDGISYLINREALKKVYDFEVGDNVKVLEDFETVKRLQDGHGGWVKYMKEACGKVGKVKKIDNDGDVAVKFGLLQWVYSPACLIPAPNQKVNPLTEIKSKQSKTIHELIVDTVISVGDRVCVYPKPDELKKMHEEVDWKEYVGQIGLVKSIEKEKVNVDFDGFTHQLHRKALIKSQLDSAKTSIEQKNQELATQLDAIKRFEKDRRKLHNQLQELKGNIRVFCRVRPLVGTEDRQNPHMEFTNQTLAIDTTKGKKTFTFDRVFSDISTQNEVFDEISQLVQSALDGYNVCIFAYGQTGSGKTYTMEGTSVDDKENMGVIPRAVLQILGTKADLQGQEWEYEIDASFLEIYNETIKDLLIDSKTDKDVKHEIKLSREKNSDNVYVTDLTVVRITDQNKVFEVLRKASENRSKGATQCNETSSRSHSVLSLKLKGKHKLTEETVQGTMYLVDLAGSENVKAAGDDERQTESKQINLSLFTLKRVILAIRQKKTHIPYRESKLTYLLQNAMAGNCKTLMFVNVSPTLVCVNETLRSLEFAENVNQCIIGQAQTNKKRVT